MKNGDENTNQMNKITLGESKEGHKINEITKDHSQSSVLLISFEEEQIFTWIVNN